MYKREGPERERETEVCTSEREKGTEELGRRIRHKERGGWEAMKEGMRKGGEARVTCTCAIGLRAKFAELCQHYA